jgi:integrase
VPILAVLRDQLTEYKMETGRDGEALVFGRTKTEPFSPATVNRRTKRVWLAPITMHECRHTFASLLIAAGASPKAIQEYMDHATIQETFDRYGHLLPGNRDEVRILMDTFLASKVAEEAL